MLKRFVGEIIVPLGGEWYDPGNEGLPFVAVYAPQGAESYAASLVDLSGNSNNAVEKVQPGWTSAAGWGFTGTEYLEVGKSIAITYPRFWQTPDGELQFCYRRGGSGNGDRMLVDYRGATGTWYGTRQIDSRRGRFTDAYGESSSRCSYPNGYTYGPSGLLHVTWVWRESSQGSNHDLMYAYSDDRGVTWRNNRGDVLTEPPHVNSPDITGDGQVSLHDLSQLATDFFGAYHFRSDLQRDGVINLSDVGRLAAGMGAQCP